MKSYFVAVKQIRNQVFKFEKKNQRTKFIAHLKKLDKSIQFAISES